MIAFNEVTNIEPRGSAPRGRRVEHVLTAFDIDGLGRRREVRRFGAEETVLAGADAGVVDDIAVFLKAAVWREFRRWLDQEPGEAFTQ